MAEKDLPPPPPQQQLPMNDEGSAHSSASANDESIIQEIFKRVDQKSRNDETSAVSDARRQCPHLVISESNPVRYYASEQDNYDNAADKMIDYWKTRLLLFGNRAWLPMTSTGEGALFKSHITRLSNAVFALTTLPCDDKKQILFLDATKLACAAADRRVRQTLRMLFFYMLQVMVEQSSSCTKGKVAVTIVVHGLERPLFSEEYFVMDNITACMPVTLEALHVLAAEADTLSTSSPLSTADKYGKINEQSEQLREIATRTFGIATERVHIYAASTRKQALATLTGRIPGLSQDLIPAWLGGAWGYERFVEWLELRCRYEWGLPPGANHQNIDTIFDFSNVKSPGLLTDEERTERTRKMNILHSRRKRERERIEVEVLQEQCSSYKTKNAELAAENSVLEIQLNHAINRVVNLQNALALSLVNNTNQGTGLPANAPNGEQPGNADAPPEFSVQAASTQEESSLAGPAYGGHQEATTAGAGASESAPVAGVPANGLEYTSATENASQQPYSRHGTSMMMISDPPLTGAMTAAFEPMSNAGGTIPRQVEQDMRIAEGGQLPVDWSSFQNESAPKLHESV